MVNFISYNFVIIEYRQPIKVGKPIPEILDRMQGEDPLVYDQQGTVWPTQ